MGGRQDTHAYRMQDLQPGHVLHGPAILINDISTVVVEPACTAHITAGSNLRIDVGDAQGGGALPLDQADPIQLAIFSHRCAPIGSL